MGRVAKRVLLEVARLGFAVLVGYVSAVLLESTCPPPTPENSSPGCEGPSLVFGAFVGFVAAIVLTVVLEQLWRLRHRSADPDDA